MSSHETREQGYSVIFICEITKGLKNKNMFMYERSKFREHGLGGMFKSVLKMFHLELNTTNIQVNSSVEQ